MAAMSGGIDRIETRLDRIERRLDLVTLPIG
jgi:tetrahydromethanopterin S-methyltransferase subunit G